MIKLYRDMSFSHITQAYFQYRFMSPMVKFSFKNGHSGPRTALHTL